MRIPGFTAERSIASERSAMSRSASPRAVSGVYPAMTILVDGVYYCEGEVTDNGVQCYGSGSRGGGGVGGGGISPVSCRIACRNSCAGKRNYWSCFRNCVMEC
jgi:hypothetical protein